MNSSEQAMDWFTRLRERELSTAERRAFAQWLMEAPSHVRQYLDTAKVWGGLQSPAIWPTEPTEDLLAIVRQVGDANVHRMIADNGAVEPPRRRTWRRFVPYAVAASLVAMAIAVWMHRDAATTRYLTARGEQRYIVLPDGSAVQLNTLTTLVVHFDERHRRIELPRGEAFFRVARDPGRPFEVQTPYARVRAIGTEFNVYNRPEGTRVAVIEGKVRVVSAATAGVDLSPQQAADVNVRGQVATFKPKRVPQTNTQPATAWRERRIVLDGDRVDSAVAEFNRYNSTQIQVKDPALAGLRITGVFNADEPNALIKYLQDIRKIEVTETTDGVILRQQDFFVKP